MTNITVLPDVLGSGNSSDSQEIPQYVGFICCGVTSLLFGTNFIPVKKFETGDGMFFQLVFCTAIIICGLVIQAVRLPRFYPFAMLGGLLWATGNLCVVPIVKTIGLGLGICIWGSVQLLVGWANSRFGLVGVEAEIPTHIEMNYGGVALSLFRRYRLYEIKRYLLGDIVLTVDFAQCLDIINYMTSQCLDIINTVLYAFVRPEIIPLSAELVVKPPEEDTTLQVIKPSDTITKLTDNQPANPEVLPGNYVERLSPIKKKVIGVVLAAISGTLYAIQFIPSIYLQEQEKKNGASQNSIDYVFAHFCGIHLSSTVYFVIYIIYRRNAPHVYPRVILPALVSGIMWGVATALWFVANRVLSEPVSFPIISTLPMGISLLIANEKLAVEKEPLKKDFKIIGNISGRRNIAIVLIAMTFTIAGAIVAGLSKT